MANKVSILLLFVALFCSVHAVTEIFVIAHSHDDVGWIVTPDQYFVSEVQYIYDTVLQQLLENSSRKFNVVEVAYLQMWWEQATSTQQEQFRQLFDLGRIEFIIGGIVMNDEAAAHYESIINQMQQGHQFLIDTFGSKAIPKIGWQIDPFGASVGTPVLLAYDCFDALVISRINYLEKDYRQDTQTMEFIWHGTSNLGAETDMFTHLLDYQSYCTPGGFSFDNEWNIYDSATNPNPPITPVNIQQRASALVDNLKTRAGFFATDNFLFPFGCDFDYQNAVTNFKNMDKLINYINANSSYGVHMKWATLSEYFDAVSQVPTTWPEYTGDFFPYNDDAVSFWTGYYTSRNELKIKSRQADAWLRSADILTALTRAEKGLSTSSVFPALDDLRLQSAIVQHHDGISGTARKIVVNHYIDRLNAGVSGVEQEIVPVMKTLSSASSLTLDHNSASTFLNSGNSVATVLYNSLGRTRHEMIHLSIPNNITVNVMDSNYNLISAQIDPDLNPGSNKAHLYFEVQLPPAGYSTYYLVPTQSTNTTVLGTVTNVTASNFTISNSFYTMSYINGQLHQVFSYGVGKAYGMNQTLMQYNSSSNQHQPGGAYIFRNDGAAAPVGSNCTGYEARSIVGPLVQSVHQVWNLTVDVESDLIATNATTSVRLYKSSNRIVGDYMDVHHSVGPLEGNRDMIIRYQIPALETNQQIYQDDSGFLTLQRNFTKLKSLITPGNYYPMVSTSYIQDSKNRFTVISANSHGCSTKPGNGVLEVMLHRRTLQDDYRGLGEPLDDYDRIKIRHRVTLDNSVNSENERHDHRLMLNNPIVSFFGSTSSPSSWSGQSSFAGLAADLPESVHLITLQIASGDANSAIVRLRLQNVFQADSISTYNGPVTINLDTLFPSTLRITEVKRLTLTGNQELSKCSRKQFGTSGSYFKSAFEEFQPELATSVTLQPSEIATFSFQLVHV